MQTNSENLTIVEAAGLLRVTTRTIGRLVASGELRSIKLARRRIISRAEIDRFVKARST